MSTTQTDKTKRASGAPEAQQRDKAQPKYREYFTIDEVLVKYQDLQAHAEGLAEELRNCLRYGSAGNENHIREALAQWEGAQK